MPFSRGKYDSWVIRSLLLAAYISVFLVQIFCITGPDSAALISSSVSVISFNKSSQKEIKENQLVGHVKKTKLSINKRFHHSIGDIILNAGDQMPPLYNGACYTKKPTSFLHVSVILSASLRGPPAFAHQTA